MTTKALTSAAAAALDAELMGTVAGYTLEQLMELAGLSVAQAIYEHWGLPPQKKQVFVIAGPGNNGGDGLVCARHLKLFGYEPIVFFPKRSSKTPFYTNLVKQLEFFNIPVLSNDNQWTRYLDHSSTLCVVDAIFGFSFRPPIREPFGTILSELKTRQETLPIVAVDVPSGWDVDSGPLQHDAIIPRVLVSLTAPKLCSAKCDPAATTHYVGGRFIPQHLAAKYGLPALQYTGCKQILRL
ncbi:NADHX epimerase Ecym_6444 [Eremothecium cymbalariae DBVPG|uniref:NAD(P)H-hydrate epimerase n=1 Tax=Eremothecium cymbalariae (strain CBS 270.75 / DBVPG 7215 / KCTC 17166 / NRRL Y-17582) TaxID=931890 RepID=G8JUN5_ERECY|nr:hypothetical protein Ecym_6444 [Eremothecium cymbalariae DBVPG\